jgi:putative methanogenesis marker protein 8
LSDDDWTVVMVRHVIEALGKTRVVIEDGKVVEVGEPLVRYCPLFAKHRGIKEITPELVRENIEFRIKDFGMCTSQRRMRMRDFLSFGVSELMGMALAKKMIDCAVVVCDGAGTVVVDDPLLVQGIGGRVSGILETDPIPEVVDAIGRDRVLDPSMGTIDQYEGVILARELGYLRVGVSVATAVDAERIRHELGSSAIIFAVHTTLVSEEDARSFFEHCDIVTACASRNVRAEASRRDIMQVGNKVPIYAVTEMGRSLLQARLEQIAVPPKGDGPEDPPVPLV